MTPTGQFLAEEIERDGPISFQRFMEVALYHPQFGYYRKRRKTQSHDPFGREGDFFTAEQLQPVFGRLIRAIVTPYLNQLGTGPHTVVELGAGRGEMAEAFVEHNYIPVDLESAHLPEHITGLVFANEFFDAIPVGLVALREGVMAEKRVGLRNGAFIWMENTAAGLLSASPESEDVRETDELRIAWLTRAVAMLNSGFLLIVDYGYTVAELARFPHGTLMSYSRHRASENVLDSPGERDITAHVNFSSLKEHAMALGLDVVWFETLSKTILRAGEADEFQTVLAADTEEERQRLRLQLKTLLFGMGETFHTLLLRRRRESQ